MFFPRDITLLLVLLTLSCSTIPSDFSTTLEPKTYELNQRTISITPLYPFELETRHQMDSYYFTHYPGMIPPQKPLIIQLTIEGKGDLIIDIDNINLISSSGQLYESQTKSEYYNNWYPKIPQSQRIRLAWLLEAYQFEENLVIAKEMDKTGYLVFLLDAPRRGDFILEIPIQFEEKTALLRQPLSLAIDEVIPTESPLPNSPQLIIQ